MVYFPSPALSLISWRKPDLELDVGLSVLLGRFF